MEKDILDYIALVGAVALPLFNIPLIAKIIKRKSSKDLSLTWVLGVWVCIILMAPSGLRSADIVWRTFNYSNVLFFTLVVFFALKYRHGDCCE